MELIINYVFGFFSGYLIGKEFIPKIEENNNNNEINENIINYQPSDYYSIFLIRKDLNMGKGKIAAQVGHASLGLFLKVSKTNPKIAEFWSQQNFPKKFYFVLNEDDMDEKLFISKELNLNIKKIRDAGRTQIPSGSATVAAIGPITEDIIPSIVGTLKEII